MDQAANEDAEIIRMLDQIPILSGIGFHEQHLVARRCKLKYVAADEVIIEQNDRSDYLYFIVEGLVIVSKKTLSQGWIKINQLSKGDFFGEIAILRNIKRTARVATKTPCTFITLNGSDFLDLYQHFPSKARDNIQLVVAKRLAQLSAY